MQWAIQLLLWSALWEQNEISIVIVIWQDSTSSRGGLRYLPDAKNSAQENAQHVCMDLLRLFLLSGILLCLSPLLCIAECGAPSPQTVFRLWQMCYIALGNDPKHDVFPFPFLTLGYLHAVETKQKRLDVLCTAPVFAVCGIDTDIEAQSRN